MENDPVLESMDTQVHELMARNTVATLKDARNLTLFKWFVSVALVAILGLTGLIVYQEAQQSEQLRLIRQNVPTNPR